MKSTHSIEIILSDICYHVANIVIDQTIEKESIYYIPKENIVIDYGFDINEQKQAGRIDHFSFHANGAAHTKYKSINRAKKHANKLPIYRKIGNLPEGLIPNKKNQFTPLMIDSIFQNNESWNLPIIPCNETFKANPWSFTSLTEFSIIVFLTDISKNPIELLHQSEFKKMNIHIASLNIPFLQKWKIVACLSWQTLPEIFPESLSIFGLSYKPKKIESFFRQLVPGPNQKAFDHLFLGRSLMMPK